LELARKKNNRIITKNRRRVPFREELTITSFLKVYTYRTGLNTEFKYITTSLFSEFQLFIFQLEHKLKKEELE